MGMMARGRMLSTYGEVVMALQGAIERGIGDGIVAPNLYRIELPTPIDAAEVAERRNELREEIVAIVRAHEWTTRTRPLLQITDRPGLERPVVSGHHVSRFGLLEIVDDDGRRSVPLPNPRALVGRSHERTPRDFVPVSDASRSLSREHLLLVCTDGEWAVELMGRNRTTIDDAELAPGEPVSLAPGDRIVCQPHTVIFREGLPEISGDNHVDNSAA